MNFNPYLFKKEQELLFSGKKSSKLRGILKSDSHVPEDFCQIKVFPSYVRKIPSFVYFVFKNFKIVNLNFLKNKLI